MAGVELEFLGNLTGIHASITQLSELLRGLERPISGIRSQLGELAEGFAAAFAVEKIKRFAEAMGELGDRIETTSVIMGVSTEDVGRLSFIAQSSGTSIEALQTSFGRLSVNISEQSDRVRRTLAGLGLSFSDFAGKSTTDQLGMLADKFSQFENGAQKSAAAEALLGRAGLQLLPFLNQGSEGISRLTAEAEAMNAVFSADTVAALSSTHHQFVMLSAAIQGAGVQAFLPFRGAVEGTIAIVRDLAVAFSDAMKSGGAIKTVVDVIAFSAKALVTALAAVVMTFRDVWSAGVLAFTAIEQGSLNFQEVVNAVVRALVAQWDAFWAALLVTGTATVRAIGQEFTNLAAIGSSAVSRDWEGVRTAFSNIGVAGTSAAGEIAEAWKRASAGVDMAPARAAMDKFTTDAKASWDAYTRSLTKSHDDFRKEYGVIWGQISAEHDKHVKDLNIAPPVDRDRVSELMKVIEGEIKAEQDGLKLKVAVWDAAAAQHRITEQDRFRNVEEATQREYEAELALLRRELDIGGLRLAQRQDIANKIAALERKHTDDMVKLDNDAIAAATKTWQGYLDTLQGAFNGQLRGLLAGTTSFAQAMKGIAADLIIALIQGVEKWAAAQLAAQLGATTAATTGAAERAAAETAGTATSIATTLGTALSKIAAGVASTIAGVSGNQALIVGPLAPAEGAAAGATVGATAIAALAGAGASLDTGTWNVPRDMLAAIHEGEIVVPRFESDAFRKVVEGGGGGGDVHLHYNQMGRIPQHEITQHAEAIARALQRTLANNRSLRPGY